MTVKSGTPLVLSILSLVVSLVVGIGAWLVARANVQRQSREAWKREFREQVAAYLANGPALCDVSQDPERAEICAEICTAMFRSYKAIHLLLAEKDVDSTFLDLLNLFQEEALDGITGVDLVTPAAVDILAAVEASGRWRRALPDWRQWRPGSQFRAWLARDPPRFPDLP